MNLAATLDDINRFSLAEADAFTRRDELLKNTQAHFDTLREAAAPLVGYLAWQSLDLGRMQRESSLILAEIRTSSDKALEEMRERKDEADKTLDAIREVSLAAGVAHHAEVFKDAAIRHEQSAQKWLVAVVVAAIAVVIAASLIVWLWDTNGDISDASVLQVVVVKGVVVVSGFYLVLNAARMYRSHSHLAVVNRHREDALRTFRAFAEGTETQAIQDQVLLAATQTIFSAGATGLIDAEEPADINPLLRLLGRT